METKMARNIVTKKKGPILVTGAAGFIGMHVCEALLARGERVVGFDALTPYNDPALKKRRLGLLSRHTRFSFFKGSISKGDAFALHVQKTKPRAIIHLAAQAGVRHSLKDPQSYVDSNVTGSLAVFEAARAGNIPVVYASSSSVYGEREGVFKETDRTDSPVSLYAATKKSTENIASAYANLYGLSLIGLRFFTVYGPWMRTDLAIYKFARLLALGKEVPLYAEGKGERSYTHVSLITDGILSALDRITPGHVVYNLGSEQTFKTRAMLQMLAHELHVKPKVKLLPHQNGDVMYTRASGQKAKRALGVASRVPLRKGLNEFAQWFRDNQKFLLSLHDMHS
jgi:UDP-glucuronate 4-epimerase